MVEDEIDKKGITAKKEENFSEWYVQVLTKSNFVDYSDVSGTLIFRPAAYAAWEVISRATDAEFKKAGIENVYFPLFIPERFLEKEKEHFKGFTPEVAWVTEAGNTKLKERLAVRPTSETIMYPSFVEWIRSWRDLPMRYNQWNNVVRWEFKHPTPFLRTREFLWNEGHTAFATKEEALAERDVVLGIYMKILKEYLALPGIIGQKSENEKFPGAVASYSIEHVLPDGFAIQGPDFHFDGQNFSKAFGIKFLDKDGKEKYVWQNTFAITTRELGVAIATHGDNKGLVLPPKIAYVQVVIIPIFTKKEAEEVMKFAKKVYDVLKENFRARLDEREGYTPGFKFNEWELKGTPIRIEIGPKEALKGTVSIVRRDTGARVESDAGNLTEKISLILDEINKNLYDKAEKFLKSNIHVVSSYEEFKEVLIKKKGIIRAPWCGSSECEENIKKETGAKTTNIPFDQKDLKEDAKCVYCGKKAKVMADFARTY